MSSEPPLLPSPQLLALLADRGVPQELLERVARAMVEGQLGAPPDPNLMLGDSADEPVVIVNYRSALQPPPSCDLAKAPPRWWSLRTAQFSHMTLLSLPDPILSTILLAALGERTDFAPMQRSLGAAICANDQQLPPNPKLKLRKYRHKWSGLRIEPWMTALRSGPEAPSLLPIFSTNWQTRGAQLSAVSKNLRLLASSTTAQPQKWQHCSVCQRDLKAMSTEWFAQDLCERISPEDASACLRPWLAKASAVAGQLISAADLRDLERAARAAFGPLAHQCMAAQCSRHICYECINANKVSRCAHAAQAESALSGDVMRSSAIDDRPDTFATRWIIPCNSVFCPDCAPEPCQVCLRTFGQPCCGGMQMTTCQLCSLIACEECEDSWTCGVCEGDFHDRCKEAQFCEGCITVFCTECDVEFFCDECETHFCSKCSDDRVACSTCSCTMCSDCATDSAEPIRYCDFCSDRFCADCRDVKFCHYCDKESCSECHAVKYCSTCDLGSCDDCGLIMQCGLCGDYTCSSCANSECECGECGSASGIKQCDSCASFFCGDVCSRASLRECSRCEHSFCQSCDLVCDCTSCGSSLCKPCFCAGGCESLRTCERCMDRQALEEAKIRLSQVRLAVARTTELLDQLKWEQAAAALRRNAKLLQSQSAVGFVAPIETEAPGTGRPEWKPTFLGRGVYPKDSMHVHIHNPNWEPWTGFDGDGVEMPMDVVSVTSPWTICDPAVLGDTQMSGHSENLLKKPILVDFVLASLGGLPEYEGKSPEELRLEDYFSGKLQTDPMSVVTSDEFELQLEMMSTTAVSACPGPYPWHWVLQANCWHLDSPEEDRLAFLMMAHASAPTSKSREKTADVYAGEEAIRWHNPRAKTRSTGTSGSTSRDRFRHSFGLFDQIQEQGQQKLKPKQEQLLPSQSRKPRRIRTFRRTRARNRANRSASNTSATAAKC